ncbi:MAG: hypothetical protein L6R37_003652 [Teloschistes peruensis]|nr:MAG: hypothetical protein L6R37_003652 [Teloschistes peruensis]
MRGTAWFLTLSILLLHWIAEDRPSYPGQLNPYVAFISDIGAQRLKPLFITGGTITALAYLSTIFAAHHVRRSSRLYAIKETQWKKWLSALALVAGVAASVGCICLTIFDARRFTRVHRTMLSTTFCGIAVSALATEGVYAKQMSRSTGFRELRK